MNKIIITASLAILYSLSYSQNLDVIVTKEAYLIACKIDSVNSSKIYIQIKTKGDEKWLQTIYSREEIKGFCYDCYDSTTYNIKNSSSLINIQTNSIYPKEFPDKSRLKKASVDELNYYLKKAKSQKTTGIVLSIAGPVAVTSVMLAANSDNSSMSLETAGAILLIGTGVTLFGIPLAIVGSSRVNKVKNALSDRVSFEITPGNFYNYQAHSHQAGVTFRLNF